MGLICPDSNRTFGAVGHDFWLQYPNCKTTFAIQCIVQETDAIFVTLCFKMPSAYMRWPIQIATVTGDLHRGTCDYRNVNAKKTCINYI